MESVNQGGGKLVDGATRAWQVVLSKITGSSSAESSAIDNLPANKPVTTTMVSPNNEPPLIQKAIPAPGDVQSRVTDSIPAGTASTMTAATPVAIETEDQPVIRATQAPRNGAVIRIPGNATVLVISPNGNSHSDADTRYADKHNSKPDIVQANNQAGNGQNQNNSEINSENNSVIASSAANTTAPENLVVASGMITSDLAAENASQTMPEPTVQALRTAPPIRIYQVQSGETLTRIAATLGTTVARLKEMNQLADDRILAGQDLVYETAQLATEVN